MALNLRLIEHALVLAQFRNFARAANHLHLSQPTLSRSISRLERSLGIRLFERNGRGIEPTAFGRILLERGAAIVRGEADLRRELELLAGLESGRLIVAAGPFAASIVGLALVRLLAAHPRLSVELAIADLEKIESEIRRGSIDVAILAAHPVGAPALKIEPLSSLPVALFCAQNHPLASRSGLRLEEILAYPIVGPRIRGRAVAQLPDECAAGRIDPATGDFLPAIKVDSLDIARRVATGTNALLLAIPGTLSLASEAGELVSLDYHERWMQTAYSIVQRADRSPSPATLAFCRAIREVDATLLIEAPASRARADRVDREIPPGHPITDRTRSVDSKRSGQSA